MYPSATFTDDLIEGGGDGLRPMAAITLDGDLFYGGPLGGQQAAIAFHLFKLDGWQSPGCHQQGVRIVASAFVQRRLSETIGAQQARMAFASLSPKSFQANGGGTRADVYNEII